MFNFFPLKKKSLVRAKWCEGYKLMLKIKRTADSMELPFIWYLKVIWREGLKGFRVMAHKSLVGNKQSRDIRL